MKNTNNASDLVNENLQIFYKSYRFMKLSV